MSAHAIRLLLVTSALMAAFASGAAAQISIVRGEAQLGRLETAFRADFAIPDAPALELVDGNPSRLLRPATVREFAIAASEFSTAGGDVQVPAAFAIEVAPFLLASARRLSIDEYRARRALYRFRVSGATGRDSLDRSAVAIGLRATLIDDGDLRTRDDYVTGVITLTDKINRLVVEERLARGRPDPRDPRLIEGVGDLTGERRAQFEALVASVDSLRRAVEDRTWNARVFDVAAGATARAADSLGTDLRMTDYAAWATYGGGIGAWGQVLVGAKGTLGRDPTTDAFTPSASVSVRLFVGTNRYKVFAEGQGAVSDGDGGAEWFVNAGGEARLLDAVWATFSSGVAWAGIDGEGPGLVGRFALKLALPDLAE